MRTHQGIVMSQLTVELVLGRLVTDERFRTQAAASLEKATLQEGYCLSQTELLLLSGVELQGFSELAYRLNPGLCRARC